MPDGNKVEQIDARAEWVERVLGVRVSARARGDLPGSNSGKGDGTIGIVQMQKSRLLWDSARKKIVGEIAELKKRAMEEFEDDPEEAQVLDALDQLDEITSELDSRLLDALDDLLSEQDPAEHAALLEDAKDILADYVEFIQTNALVQNLNGETPFGMSLSIGSTLAATVKALQANIR